MEEAQIMPYIKVLDTYDYFKPTLLPLDEYMRYAVPFFIISESDRDAAGEFGSLRDCTIDDFKGNE